ncbi:uncharacterized protein PADG_06272 [Paracoccidioides brasiliensis Pb18]|uniref:Methyltransferase domain-containing protein n=2 Tax=Paracoccidioides brasiliensis TaxID=121759 RepID=C1GG35_PARBD|nr:uncharacterized protein PADG_06272 [Paracoccidioides brasiliensis Pb18]EEH50193.2 hypothetical protein PADG_06272 [Paracoccidioides brasiliensis Pb18]ODH44719.1 hypothetical protein ACO22_00797 [Paracoccidioides brasiliensis]
MSMANESTPISVDSESENSYEHLEDGNFSSFAQSLASTVVNQTYENGRRYHSFREGGEHSSKDMISWSIKISVCDSAKFWFTVLAILIAYIFPNDEKENNRLDIVHHMMYLLCDEQLHLAPIGESPQNILDIGAGTGLWCCQMGDDYPSAQILGIDLSPIRNTFDATPDNVRFEVDDVESEWTFINNFDYIHSRYMTASIRDWPKLIERCYSHLMPGGWAEFQDSDARWYSDDDSYNQDSALGKWLKLFHEAAYTHGRELAPGPKLEGWVRNAGFTDVVTKKLRVPIGKWPRDPKLKTIGTWNLIQIIEGMEGFSMALFSRVLGWSPDAIQAFVSDVVEDLRNPKMHALFDLYIVYGRKPEKSTSQHSISGPQNPLTH